MKAGKDRIWEPVRERAALPKEKAPNAKWKLPNTRTLSIKLKPHPQKPILHHRRGMESGSCVKPKADSKLRQRDAYIQEVQTAKFRAQATTSFLPRRSKLTSHAAPSDGVWHCDVRLWPNSLRWSREDSDQEEEEEAEAEEEKRPTPLLRVCVCTTYALHEALG